MFKRSRGTSDCKFPEPCCWLHCNTSLLPRWRSSAYLLVSYPSYRSYQSKICSFWSCNQKFNCKLNRYKNSTRFQVPKVRNTTRNSKGLINYQVVSIKQDTAGPTEYSCEGKLFEQFCPGDNKFVFRSDSVTVKVRCFHHSSDFWWCPILDSLKELVKFCDTFGL